LPCHGTQIATDLLRWAELKGKGTANVRRHPATPTHVGRQLPTIRRSTSGRSTSRRPKRGLQDTDQARLRELLGGTAYQEAHRSGSELSPALPVELAPGRETAR
jgi:hypothetical protein